MIVRETSWDDRNLGLKTHEISVVDSDVDTDVLSKVGSFFGLKDSYCVIKIPPKRVSLIHQLEQNGFRFLEAQSDLHKKLTAEFTFPSFLKAITKSGGYDPIEKPEECERLISGLDGVFDSDRVCLDPSFGECISTLRYRNWIRDCFGKKDYHLAWIKAGDKNVGFFFMKEIDELTADSTLAGLFPEYKNSGYGPLVISVHCDFAKAIGKKKILARVSLNNMESLRMHLAFGYEIVSSHYVMRYMPKGI